MHEVSMARGSRSALVVPFCAHSIVLLVNVWHGRNDRSQMQLASGRVSQSVSGAVGH